MFSVNMTIIAFDPFWAQCQTHLSPTKHDKAERKLSSVRKRAERRRGGGTAAEQQMDPRLWVMRITEARPAGC